MRILNANANIMKNQNESQENTNSAKRERDLKIARWLFTLMSFVICGIGLLAIFTQHYYGYTSKYGGHEVSLEGATAVKIGFGWVVFGLFPLAFWAKTDKAAAIWASCCIAAGLYIILFVR